MIVILTLQLNDILVIQCL